MRQNGRGANRQSSNFSKKTTSARAQTSRNTIIGYQQHSPRTIQSSNFTLNSKAKNKQEEISTIFLGQFLQTPKYGHCSHIIRPRNLMAQAAATKRIEVSNSSIWSQPLGQVYIKSRMPMMATWLLQKTQPSKYTSEGSLHPIHSLKHRQQISADQLL
ncbi:hypothetical protein Nepgr_012432 [Nepenthes gracilis]|uniref:Uncharacterized protein n=1 Tax=Nepenthes gracilis TaxID=150966 RepID=A0AAD3XNB5_NEPGR|nr:hypothetical protein Nepgr_012432 [Nepenthes gracilis]